MTVTKQSIAESSKGLLEGEIRFRDVRHYGPNSKLFSTPCSEESIWLIRADTNDFPSLSGFFVTAYLTSQDDDWGIIQDDLSNWRGLKRIGRAAAIESIQKLLFPKNPKLELVRDEVIADLERDGDRKPRKGCRQPHHVCVEEEIERVESEIDDRLAGATE